MKIYNTLTGKKQEFIPVKPGQVSIYACGPTVYNYFHIGNARSFMLFDVVRRWFDHCGYKVRFVQNVTDVDDKIIAQSIKEGLSASQVAERYLTAYQEDRLALGLIPPDEQPLATAYVPDMVEFISELVDAGLAYASAGDVFFRVKRSADYGKLSGKKLDELQIGARVAENDAKEEPWDFVLWKAAKPGEPSWDSPWGPGRPGWHTECVVMSHALLGQPFDIHGGGSDLIFPHHENEIAQAECLYGQPMANIWMHNGFLNVGGEKMSKSLNNFFLARDVLKLFDAEALRFFFLSKHYRNSIDYSQELIKEADTAISRLYSALEILDFEEPLPEPAGETPEETSFTQAMDDDFNTAAALASLFALADKARNQNCDPDLRLRYASLLYKLGRVLGFFQHPERRLKKNLGPVAEQVIDLLVVYRNECKQNRQWDMADRIRKDLLTIGIELQDTKEGTTWKVRKK